ncbi:MAG: DNA/RNA nuclease SfsA [Rhodospirillaceae bacterium]|nr:DNA/RNA nuclease SfsA [Rhodospirillaceae bacterium]
MNFPSPLISGTLVRRYKRFLADIRLDDGTEITAHIANSGAMTGLKEPGLRVWISRSNNPKRKLAYTWELVDVDGGLVGVNTAHPNALVAEAILDGRIPELTGYADLRREVAYGKNSRIDIQLSDSNRPRCLVEVKNVHLMRHPGLAEFPDAVTARGTKHLQEMADAVAAGDRAVMVYLVQRTDCSRFSLAADIDPAYAQTFKDARAQGVEALCYACTISTTGLALDHPLPLAL